MKKNINRFMFTLSFAAILLSCEEDEEPTQITTDFSSIASTYNEKDGTATVVIPFRNGTADFASKAEVSLGGTATEGQDYTLGAVTAEGVQISIIDDNVFEPNETIRVQIPTSNGNSIHTITIVSNCEDTESPYLKYFAGTYSAIEKYGPTEASWYGPYEIHFEQDSEDPTKFHLDNFYDSGRSAYLVFDVATGKVHFPDQQPLPDPGAPTLLTASSGTFVIDDCNSATTLTISLNYDGGVWEYSFLKL